MRKDLSVFVTHFVYRFLWDSLGHFGIVSRATYNAPDGATKKVACKILKQSIASVSDFITEGNRLDLG